MALRRALTFIYFLAAACVAHAHSDHSLKVYVRGAELSYVEQGSGPVVILLHDELGDYSSWQPQMLPFASKFRVISYSRRYASPNNNPPAPADYSLLTDVDDLAQFIEKLGLQDVRLVGHSAGGFVALAYALKHPEMVHSLVLSEPCVYELAHDDASYQDFFKAVWAPTTAAFRSHDTVSAVRAFVPNFDSLPTPARADLTRNARSLESLALSAEPFPSLSMRSLKRLNVPTLILTGANTTPLYKRINSELIRTIPGAQSTTIPNAAHNSPRENIPAFIQTVMPFLTENP